MSSLARILQCENCVPGRTVSNFGKADWKRAPRHLERDDGDRRFRFAFARRAPPFDGAGRCATAPDDLQLLVSARQCGRIVAARSEEHMSELQSLMRMSYAFFCLKKINTSQTLMTSM